MSEALLAYDSFLRACPTKVLVWIIGQVKCQVTVTCTIFSLKMNEKVQKSFDGPMHGFSYMIYALPSCIPKRRYVKRPQGFFGALHPPYDGTTGLGKVPCDDWGLVMPTYADNMRWRMQLVLAEGPGWRGS